VVDAWLSWPESIRGLFTPTATKDEVDVVWTHEIVPSVMTNPTQKFSLAKRSEIYGRTYLASARAGRLFPSLWDFGQTAMQYTNADVVHRITTPYLVMSYQLENFFPGEAQAPYSLLPRRKILATLTTAEGAEYHDAPMAPEKHNQVVFDWMDTTLGV